MKMSSLSFLILFYFYLSLFLFPIFTCYFIQPKMCKALFSIIALFLISAIAIANPTDSLEIWKEKAAELAKTDRVQSNAYYFKLRDLAQKNKDHKEYLFANRKIGINYILLKEFGKAEKTFRDAIPLAKEETSYEELGHIYHNIGVIKYQIHNPLKAIEFFRKAAVVNKASKNEGMYAYSLLNLGTILKRQGIYDKAMNHIYEAIPIFERNEMQYKLASSYNTLASIQKKIKNPQLALQFHQKSLQIRRRLNNKEDIASSLNNIGNLYKEISKLDSAMLFYNKSLEIKKELRDTSFLISTYSSIAEVKLRQNEYKQAELYLNFCLENQDKIYNVSDVIDLKNELGYLHLKRKEFDKAQTLLDKAYKIAKEAKSQNSLMKNLELKIELAKVTNNTKSISSLYEEYIRLKDLILDSKKNKALTEMQIRYDVDKQKQKNQLLTETTIRQQAQLEANELKNILLIFGIITSVIISAILLVVFRQRNKHNKLLQHLLVEQQHRVKNFLNTIASIFRMHERRAKDDAVKEAVKEGSDRLNAMLLIHKQLDRPSVDAPANINFTDYTQKLVDQLKMAYSGYEKVINTELDLDGDLNLDVNKAVSLGLILNEVVTNAFKYAVPQTENPSVTISLKKSKKQVVLSIQDNGPGIDTSKSTRKESSLGLKLIQLFTKNLNATYEIVNNNGTLFSVKFTE